MAQTAEDQFELSLMEFLRGFMEYAHLSGHKTFPPFQSKLWHQFLWEVKERCAGRFFPILECLGPFDWDGPYPKQIDLNVELFGLRFVCFSKVAGGRIELDISEIRKDNPFSKYCPHIAHSALRLAEEIPGFFEPR